MVTLLKYSCLFDEYSCGQILSLTCRLWKQLSNIFTVVMSDNQPDLRSDI